MLNSWFGARKAKPAPVISVILPFWQRNSITEFALDAMARLYRDLAMEVIFVDDGSPDPLTIGKHYPWPVKVMRLPAKDVPKNPCVPINRGVKEASADVIVLSNPEIIHDQPIFPAMLEELQRLGENGYVLAAAWCPEQELWHCHSSVAGDRPTGEKQPAGSGYHFCAMLYKSLFERAGGFDEEYREGAGYDDPDWVNRVHRAGAVFKIRDDLVVIHTKYGAQTAWPSGAFARNRAIYARKWGLSA